MMNLPFKIPSQPPRRFGGRENNNNKILPWLDAIALLAWGALLMKYWATGQLKLLIHPHYFWLVLSTSIALLSLGSLQTWQLIKKPSHTATSETHITIFPPGWGSGLLLITALTGFLIAPGVLDSDAAIQRGLSESLPLTREQPQTFRTTTKPEERTIIDWVRTLNAYPEPDAYNGQKAKVQGFVVHLPQLPENYLLIARFVITCCAVDAYPIGIPVKLNENRSAYPPDTWLEIEGQMSTETFPESPAKRQLVLAANSLKKIPTPPNPYDYNDQ